MFGPSLFDIICQEIQNWKPKTRYRSEEGYRDDLKEYLRKVLNTPPPFSIGQPPRHKVTSESGRHLCDIAVDESIGVELKHNLKSRPQVDRLIGQVKRYLNYYSGIIVVAVGNMRDDIREEVRGRLGELLPRGLVSLAPQKRIAFVNKTEIVSKRPTSSPFGL